MRVLILCTTQPSPTALQNFRLAVSAFGIEYFIAVNSCEEFLDSIEDCYPTILGSHVWPEAGLFKTMKIDHLVLCAKQDESYQKWIDAAQAEGVGIINLMEGCDERAS